MRIALTGSSGLIGSTLDESLTQKGHTVVPLIRPTTRLTSNRKMIRWNPDFGHIDAAALEGFDGVIHLSGVNIAERWTPKYKSLIRESRIKSTSFLSNVLAQLKNPPKAFLCASAVGIYGDSAKTKDEISLRGKDFLADVCSSWEMATEAADHRGIRVVNMRFGVVLSKRGGMLKKILPIFKLGLGGKIGSGQQMMSWVADEEIPFMVLHVLQTPSLRGAVNFTSPEPVSNEEFTKVLSKVLRRPAVLPVPARVLKFMFGEMADTMLLASSNAIPKRLLESGYQFSYPALDEALAKILLSK